LAVGGDVEDGGDVLDLVARAGHVERDGLVLGVVLDVDALDRHAGVCVAAAEADRLEHVDAQHAAGQDRPGQYGPHQGPSQSYHVGLISGVVFLRKNSRDIPLLNPALDGSQILPLL